jgi:hypothetical protein
MRSTVAQSIGVDISKDALDVAIHPGGDLCQRFDILTSIPGVGEVTANVLVVESPQRGRLEHAQAASLVVWRLSRGTAARPMESDPSAAGPTSPTGSLHARPQRHPIDP